MTCTSPVSFGYTGSNGTVIAHYQFRESHIDSSANGYHLTMSAGREQYIKCWPWEHLGAWFNGATYLTLNNSADNADFRITGDITILYAGRLSGSSNTSFDSHIVRMGAEGGGESENLLYSLEFEQEQTVFKFLSESGSSVNNEVTFNVGRVRSRSALGFKRDGTTIYLYDKYGLIDSGSVVLPTGGGSSELVIGSNTGNSTIFQGMMQELMFISGALSEEEIITELTKMHSWDVI